jgi:hypothetical protein
MIRKQLYIDQRHEQKLKRLASERGVTEAEIVRDAIDRAESRRLPSRRIPNIETGRKLIQFMRTIGSHHPRSAPRPRWTRESLYEERIGRWTKS